MKKTVIITAGGTSEPIDQVRKITNNSTGKLGSIICNTILEENESLIRKIYYLCSKDSIKPTPNDKIEFVYITDTASLEQNTKQLLTNNKIDTFIHSMAVSDYTTDYVTTASLLAQDLTNKKDITEAIKTHKGIDNNSKISSYEDNLIIKLKPTPKIINIIKKLSPETFLIGFKLLNNVKPEELFKVSSELLNKNNCDVVIGNDLSKIKTGHHEAIFVNKEGIFYHANSKEDISKKISGIIKEN